MRSSHIVVLAVLALALLLAGANPPGALLAPAVTGHAKAVWVGRESGLPEAVSTVPCDTAGPLPGPPPLGLDALLPVPDDNPLTRAGVALGSRLFRDPILSLDHSMRCASCHRPDHAFSDTAALSPGVRGTNVGRNAPSLLNRGYGKSFFRDGRASSLEAAVLQPIHNPDELALPLDSAVARLRRDSSYVMAFRRATRSKPSEPALARVLASYIRTLRSGDSDVDRYMAGDTTALSAEALRGLRLFDGRANCTACHSGPTFTDEDYHDTGVSYGSGDVGRSRVTGRAEDRGRFRVPSLRNVALTAPYMHDGSLRTLADVVAFYDRGGNPNPNLDREIHPLHLSAADRRALVAFLRALTGRCDRCCPRPSSSAVP